MITLVYIDKDLSQVFISAEAVTHHPDNTITFKLLDSEFRRNRLGFGSSAYVEKQAAPAGQTNSPDRFYWIKQTNP